MNHLHAHLRTPILNLQNRVPMSICRSIPIIVNAILNFSNPRGLTTGSIKWSSMNGYRGQATVIRKFGEVENGVNDGVNLCKQIQQIWSPLLMAHSILLFQFIIYPIVYFATNNTSLDRK